MLLKNQVRILSSCKHYKEKDNAVSWRLSNPDSKFYFYIGFSESGYPSTTLPVGHMRTVGKLKGPQRLKTSSKKCKALPGAKSECRTERK